MRHWFRRSKKAAPPASRRDAKRYKRLPTRVKTRDATASHPVTPPRDPYGGRDTDRDFIIRYGDPFDDG
jgi:hypothetical protein